ncbi:transcription antitermination factor NusB [Flexivirga meconopsidis]|uniref:transcription antitermination factor NusB n=1 Tax=Flexivirga meconopsidis TaxID=2977121 RepID=UPI0031345FAD
MPAAPDGGEQHELVSSTTADLSKLSARGKARKKALDILFEAEQRGDNAVALLEQRIAAPTTQTPLPDYTVQIVRGVVENWVAINEALTTYSRDWPLDRMPSVDRALLRGAAWELIYNDEIDDPVVISEAVRLAGALSTEQSPKFVGGLLNKLAAVKQTLV